MTPIRHNSHWSLFINVQTFPLMQEGKFLVLMEIKLQTKAFRDLHNIIESMIESSLSIIIYGTNLLWTVPPTAWSCYLCFPRNRLGRADHRYWLENHENWLPCVRVRKWLLPGVGTNFHCCRFISIWGWNWFGFQIYRPAIVTACSEAPRFRKSTKRPFH